HRMEAYIQRIVQLRQAFVMHGLLGLSERPLNAKKPDGDREVDWHPGIVPVKAKDWDALLEWKRVNAAEIARVVMDIVKEWHIVRNVVAIWQPQGRVLVRPPEQCV